MCLFFFFKQKTAYDMRISDWSSDVCSSDLPQGHSGERDCDRRGAWVHDRDIWTLRPLCEYRARHQYLPDRRDYGTVQCDSDTARHWRFRAYDRCGCRCQRRSEEHTSELQSLMRISYAVFCLKKKTPKLTSLQTR